MTPAVRPNPADADAIAYVAATIHRHPLTSRRDCKCERCRALRRVVRLATAGATIRPARRRVLAGGR